MNFTDRFTKKIFPCPSCYKKLRVPIRPGKTLMVSCPGCQTQFNIQFKNPWSDFFQWYKGRGILFNLKSFYFRFKLLPLVPRIGLIVGLVMILQMAMGAFNVALKSSDKPAKNLEHFDSAIVEEV